MSIKQNIIDLRLSGLTYNQIWKNLKCSKSTISYHCRKNGLSDSNKLRIPDKNLIIQMQEMYDNCLSAVKVALHFGWSVQTVRKYISTIKLNYSEEQKLKNKSISVIKHRQRNKIKLVEYKGGKCQCCDYSKSICVLQFHHLNPEEKDFTIGSANRSFEKLKKEVDKCIMVCSNCHIEIHEEIRINGFSEKLKNIGY